jgi:hypothetical protein
VIESLVPTFVVNMPPMSLELDTEQESALLEVQLTFRPCPRLMVVACEGEVIATMGIGMGMGVL